MGLGMKNCWFLRWPPEKPGLIYVKFGITPQTGAYDPLGYDELVYRVDSRGNKETNGYKKFIKSFVALTEIRE